MSIDTIVCPVDLSELSWPAARHAASIAHDAHARLWLVHVQQSPISPGPKSAMIGETIPGKERADETRRELDRLARAIADENPSEDISTEVLTIDQDSIASRIEKFARNVQADLIVMGTHGRRGLRRLFLGSVAEEVLRTSDHPLLIVPPATARGSS